MWEAEARLRMRTSAWWGLRPVGGGGPIAHAHFRLGPFGGGGGGAGPRGGVKGTSGWAAGRGVSSARARGGDLSREQDVSFARPPWAQTQTRARFQDFDRCLAGRGGQVDSAGSSLPPSFPPCPVKFGQVPSVPAEELSPGLPEDAAT